MTKCRFILMNKGVCESDFVCEVEKPLIDESRFMDAILRLWAGSKITPDSSRSPKIFE